MSKRRLIIDRIPQRYCDCLNVISYGQTLGDTSSSSCIGFSSRFYLTTAVNGIQYSLDLFPPTPIPRFQTFGILTRGLPTFELHCVDNGRIQAINRNTGQTYDLVAITNNGSTYIGVNPGSNSTQYIEMSSQQGGIVLTANGLVAKPYMTQDPNNNLVLTLLAPNNNPECVGSAVVFISSAV